MYASKNSGLYRVQHNNIRQYFYFTHQQEAGRTGYGIVKLFTIILMYLPGHIPVRVIDMYASKNSGLYRVQHNNMRQYFYFTHQQVAGRTGCGIVKFFTIILMYLPGHIPVKVFVFLALGDRFYALLNMRGDMQQVIVFASCPGFD
jgi:hypothetical protein